MNTQLIAVAALMLAAAPSLTTAQTLPNTTTHPPSRPCRPNGPCPSLAAKTRCELSIPMRVIRPGRPDDAAAARARAKKVQEEMERAARSIDYSGPRFGITYLRRPRSIPSRTTRSTSARRSPSSAGSFEREIHVSPDGPRVLNEWVFPRRRHGEWGLLAECDLADRRSRPEWQRNRGSAPTPPWRGLAWPPPRESRSTAAGSTFR